MAGTHTFSGAVRDAAARRRTAAARRRAVLILGATGVIAGAAVMAAAPALAGVGSEPGNLKFSPASGALTVTPTWSTTDGCPAGYQKSAQMAIFNASGVLLSRISPVAYDVTHSFSGTLDGNLSAILRYANVSGGGTLEFAVGCYTLVGGTGEVKWIQSTLVTASAGGTSYTTSAPSGQQHAASGAGASGTNSGPGAAPGNAGAGGGMGAAAEAALIAGACVLVAAAAGYVWYRRRDRSRLM